MLAKGAQRTGAILASLVVAAIIGGAAVQAADEPENVLKYRKNIMGAQAGHISAISAVVKGEVSYSGHVAAHARALNALAMTLPDIFPAGSAVGDSRALPEIWSDAAKFEQVTKEFQAATAQLVTAAESGDMAAIGDALGATGKGCGGCHKPFRKEKE